LELVLKREEKSGTTMRSVVGSSEEGPSNGQKLVIPGRDKAKKQMVSIPRLLHQREIRGQSTTMRSVRAWNRLCLMKMPHTLEINEHCYDLLRDAVFLGMSNDSSYVIGILYSSSSDRYIGADVEMVLIVMQLSPTQLIPAFVGDLHSKRMHEVFATFPQDSSFIAVLSFTEEIARHGLSGSDPMTTLIGIDFILFKFSIHLSMSTSIVLSSRWKKRLCRTLLRCFDKGAILNAGTTLVCILFTNYYSHNQTQTTTTPITTTTQRALRKSFQILEGEDNVGDRNEWSGVVLQEIHIVDAHPRSSPR
uniref:JAB_MPN domain-containing protein n=1 Tax=Anisakis simplex TaxID=6269 RepID=A0A0M3J196_ANISI